MKKNVASLTVIIGTISILLALFPVIRALSLILGLVGITLAIVAIIKQKEKRKSAFIGFLLAFLSIPLAFALTKTVDYSSATNYVTALKANKAKSGQTVEFKVQEIMPMSSEQAALVSMFGGVDASSWRYMVGTENGHLSLALNQKPPYKVGDTVEYKVTETKNMDGDYIIDQGTLIK